MLHIGNLLKKEHTGEMVVVVLLILYLVLGVPTPDLLVPWVNHVIGKVVVVLGIVYLFLNAHPLLAGIAALAAFELVRRSATGMSSLTHLSAYAPSEQKKMSHFTAFNQFPYTLEQEVVAKMAPLVHSGNSITPPSYKPSLDNLHDATTL